MHLGAGSEPLIHFYYITGWIGGGGFLAYYSQKWGGGPHILTFTYVEL